MGRMVTFVGILCRQDTILGSSIPSAYTNGTSFDSPTSALPGQTGGFKQQPNEYMPTPTMSHKVR